MRFARSFLVLLFSSQAGCAGEDPAPEPIQCSADADCSATPETPLCDTPNRACVALPPGHQIGFRDGSPASVALVPVFEPAQARMPTDLAFNPAKPTELWVVNRQDDSVDIIQRPGAPDMTWERRYDPAADHFMAHMPALAFGVESADWGMTWATCGDGTNGGNGFIGPALFSADLDVFATDTLGGLGSHLDMLHSTELCRGIAHVEANVYWVFNADQGSLDKYDFKEDHGPGNDDHADGEIYRYAQGLVRGVDDIPSHIIHSAEDRQLYIADTGNQRIARLDTESGEMGPEFGGDEPVVERRHVVDAAVADVVPPGLLQAPSGIELHDGLLFVTDHATSRFHAFDLNGQLVRTLDTGLLPGSLAGFTFGPDDGKVYFTDLSSGIIYRIDPLF